MVIANKRRCLVLVVLLTCLIILTKLMNPLSELLRLKFPSKKSEGMMESTSVFREEHENEMISTSTSTKDKAQKASIVLLVYTTFFGNKEWFYIRDDCSLNGKRKTSCKKDMIDVTYDKQRFIKSDFVLFHAKDDMPSVDHLQTIIKDKPSSQFWIYFSQESPMSTPDTAPLNGMFDLTYTYRSDSDFVASYGDYQEIPFSNSREQDFSVGKDKLLFWMVSNCRPQLRKSFVRELQKYVVVDVFGKCSTEFGPYRSCPRKESCVDIFKHYKFYLSLENALCEDYITEKYWSHLGEENVIPIVMGGANYTKLAIPGSYINVMDFKTVKDLADYLHYLDKNNTAYNEYFKWRQKYRAIPIPFYCSFCEAVSSNTWHKPRKDLTDYWITHGKCNEKDQMVLNMWSRNSALSCFIRLITITLITTIMIALMVYIYLYINRRIF